MRLGNEHGRFCARRCCAIAIEKADIMTNAVIPQADADIRRLTVDDLDLFRDIRAEALQKHPQSFWSPEEDEGGDAMMAAYRHWLNGAVFAAFGRSGLIGVAGFYVSTDKRSQHRGHIFTVYVRENDRGNGVGDRLIKELLAHAEACVEQVHLAVLLNANAAIRTYKRNGFEVYGIDPRAVRIGDTTYDKYLW
jgi:ribosomal protein S18 acetylase RimI-like enzyme